MEGGRNHALVMVGGDVVSGNKWKGGEIMHW